MFVYNTGEFLPLKG